MSDHSLTLRKVAKHPEGGALWLATIGLDDGQAWCLVRADERTGLAMASVVGAIEDLPWRSDTPTRLAVGKAVLAVTQGAET